MPFDELQPLLDQNTWVFKGSYETHRTFVSQTHLSIAQLTGQGMLSSPYIRNYEYIGDNSSDYLNRIKKKNFFVRTGTQLYFRDETGAKTILSEEHEQLMQLDEMFLTTYPEMPSTVTPTLFDLHRIKQILKLSEDRLPTPIVNSFHSPERVKRLWSIINPPQYPLLTSPFAWLTLEPAKEVLSDVEMTNAILQFYREKRRLLIDPFNSLFKIRDATQTALLVCDDVITAWPRGFVIDNFEQQQVNETQLIAWYEKKKATYPKTVLTLKCLLSLEEYHVAENMDNCHLDPNTLLTLSQLQSENAPMSDVNLEIFISLRDTGILADLTSNNRAALYANLAKNKYAHALMYIVTHEPNYTALHLQQQKARLSPSDFEAYIETTNTTNRTALIQAASLLGNESAVTALLEQGANINARTIHHHTALLLAITIPSVEIVRRLCLHPELDITLRSDKQFNALDIAIARLDFFLEPHNANPASTTLITKQQYQDIIDLLLKTALQRPIEQQQAFLSRAEPSCQDILEYMACYYGENYYELSRELTEQHPLFTKRQYILKVTQFLSKIDFDSFLAFLKQTMTDCQHPQQKETLFQLYQKLHMSRLVFLRGTNLLEQIKLFQSNCKTLFDFYDKNLINKYYYYATGISSLFLTKKDENTFRTYYQTTKKSWTTNLEQLAPSTFLS